jgi:DNA-binding winged helix-turn-helix (wHTH) protein/Tfp pilus assembly protein PilF
MKLDFGPFQLDEAAHTLTLRGVPQPIQPRVFELLAYLLKNAGRVVPKDELMDMLWPNVIVTESSLQRAASLARRALAAGGLGDAIRNIAKYGYRFAIDDAQLGALAPIETGPAGPLAAAREAALRREWEIAADHFAQANAEASAATPLAADDLELWALVIECCGRPVDAVPVLIRTVEAHLAAGLTDRAGRAAVTLSKVELERGSSSAAQGWIERAESILGPAASASARAYLLWMKSRLATFTGRAEDALALASEASSLAEATGDNGLRALTLVYKGFYHLSLGHIGEGTRLQNHAAAIALSSQVDAITGSLVYCNILWSCRTFADWERALQWSDGFEAWCDASFTEHPGSCDLHRAEVLGARGTLREAFDKISAAIPKLVDEETWSLGDGYRVRGDLAAMLGDLETAEADYATAYAVGWDAEPGHAVLLFEQGKPDAALAALDRVLQGKTWWHLQRRGLLLVNAARIAALSGQAARAEAYLTEVEAGEDRWPQPAIRALVTETRAALLDQSDPAANQLRLLARQLWTSARLDYHAARVRLELAATYLAAGDTAGAEAEIGAAEWTARRIASPRLLKAAAALRDRLATRAA